jgi:hypothetical protein
MRMNVGLESLQSSGPERIYPGEMPRSGREMPKSAADDWSWGLKGLSGEIVRLAEPTTGAGSVTPVSGARRVMPEGRALGIRDQSMPRGSKA